MQIQKNNEIWKDIEWYEWKYQVSNLWRVKSLNYWRRWEEKIRKLWNRSWYAILILHKNGKVKCELVHRLVATAFIENSKNKFCVNHKNGIRDDNRVENLEWCTTSENIKHSFRELWRHIIKWSEHVRSKSVLQYSIWWQFIKKWSCMMEIQRSCNFSNAHISKVCLGKRDMAYWFIWKFCKN